MFMAVKKVYGSTAACPATMRVLASLFEHGIDFDFISVDLEARGSLEGVFPLPKHSFDHQTTVIITDFTAFFLAQESRAIMRFISHHYPKLGKEQVYLAPKQQGIVAAWIDVEDHQFDPPTSKLRIELLEKCQNGCLAEKRVVAEEEANLAKVLDVYEERLKYSNYLGGDKFTSFDFTHLPNLYHLMKTPVRRLFDERAHVSVWCANLLARSAWAKIVDRIEKK